MATPTADGGREQEQFLATTRKVITGRAEAETLQENLTVAKQDACHRHRGTPPDLEALDASLRGTPIRSYLPRSSV